MGDRRAYDMEDNCCSTNCPSSQEARRHLLGFAASVALRSAFADAVDGSPMALFCGQTAEIHGGGVEIWRCMSSLAPCMFVVNLCPGLVRCVVYTVVNYWKVKTTSLSIYIYLSLSFISIVTEAQKLSILIRARFGLPGLARAARLLEACRKPKVPPNL